MASPEVIVKRSRYYKPLKDNKELIQLHSEGLSDEEIADRMGLSKHLATRNRRELGLPDNLNPPRLVWNGNIHDNMLIKLHEKNWGDTRIAAQLGFCRNTISTHRRRLGLPLIIETVKGKGKNALPPEVYPKPVDGGKPKLSALQFAFTMLHGRFRTIGQNLTLDGMPSNLNLIMKEANKAAVKHGEFQFTRNPEWIVPCP